MERMKLGTAWAVAALLAGCHPPVEGSREPTCTLVVPPQVEPVPDSVAELGQLLDGAFVPFESWPQAEVVPDPREGGDATFVVPARLRIRRPDARGGGCVWVLTPEGQQTVAFAADEAREHLLSTPVYFDVGSDLEGLDGVREVKLLALFGRYRASATVRPVNHQGFLSGP